MPLAGIGVGDGLQQIPTPEPSCHKSAKWIQWCTQQLDMPAWWWECREVPGQGNIQEFTRMVWASFRVPKVTCCTSKVDNNYSTPPAPNSLDRDQFLLLQDMQFGSQDFWLTQPQKTLVYAKDLQHWLEKAQPPTPGKPHQLAESVLELWHTMEPLTTFTDEEVLEDTLPSNWVKMASSRTAEPAPREHSCSRTHKAHARGSFLAAYGEG